MALTIATRAMIVAALLSAIPGAPQQSAAKTDDVVLAAVSRDMSLLTGGIEGTSLTPRGTANIEPIARLSRAGSFTHLPCDRNSTTECEQFQRDYLSKVRNYELVSIGKPGSAPVKAAPATLDECYGYVGSATYVSHMPMNALAASSTQQFASAPEMKQLDDAAMRKIIPLLARAIGGKSRLLHDLHGWSFTMNGARFFALQRTSPGMRSDALSFTFVLARRDDDDVEIQYWRDEDEDEIERVLGTFKLQSGPEFLVTVVNDPEGHSYRVYRAQDGHLQLVFVGGGSSC